MAAGYQSPSQSCSATGLSLWAAPPAAVHSLSLGGKATLGENFQGRPSLPGYSCFPWVSVPKCPKLLTSHLPD